MKLAACYTVFDGAELLNSSILTIYPQVDLVVICFQSISNKGQEIKADDWDYIESIRGYKIIHEQYVTDLKLTPKENERRKHNQMVGVARAYGATHFLMAACDHFYKPDEFAKAKEIAGEYDSTFTAMYTYFKKPMWQLDPIENYFMPFICKLYPHTRIERVKPFPLLVDPSVQMNTIGKWYQFRPDEIMLHHYSMVRKDVHRKFLNAASPWKPQQVEEFTKEVNEYNINENPGVKYFHGTKLKVVPDYFGINHIFETFV